MVRGKDLRLVSPTGTLIAKDGVIKLAFEGLPGAYTYVVDEIR